VTDQGMDALKRLVTVGKDVEGELRRSLLFGVDNLGDRQRRVVDFFKTLRECEGLLND
jgi:hypothetical protein